MKALVYKGPYKVAVEEVEDPRIEEPTDVIVKMTSTCICGSDLHMYDGRTDVKPGQVLGHEPMGIVHKVGDAISQLKVGDRVSIPFNIGCGDCFNCVRGYTNACLIANPDGVGAGYGYAGLGPFRGGQAELLRVPYADFNCLKLPNMDGGKQEDDFAMLADIFPTAYHSAVLAKVGLGKTVAIYGAGPVGLLAITSSQLMGAAEIYVVDQVPERLDLVKQLGAIPINFSEGDPVEQIKAMRLSSNRHNSALRKGEEKMTGVMCGIDAVGFQCHNERDTKDELYTQVNDDLAKLVNPTGAIGSIGVYFPKDPGAPKGSDQAQGIVPMAFGEMWNKGISLNTGQAPVKQYNEQLRDLIIAGKANPSVIVSHHIPLEEAPDAYAKFDKRVDGYTKVIINPNGPVA